MAKLVRSIYFALIDVTYCKAKTQMFLRCSSSVFVAFSTTNSLALSLEMKVEHIIELMASTILVLKRSIEIINSQVNYDII